MNEKRRLAVAVFLLAIYITRSAFAEHERNILENQAFGCEWQGGGIATTLLCSCRWQQEEELYIQENTIQTMDLNMIRIKNCEHVKFGSNAVQSIRNLRRIELSNIQHLILEESSLHWEGYVANGDANTPSLRILIENSNVRQISSYTFKGRINDISFNNVVVENLGSFSFSSLMQNQNIFLANSNFNSVQPQAFKKFSTEYLTITNCTFQDLPSRSFSELIVMERFLIQNSTFNTIKSAAFLVHNPIRFEVTNSKFMILEGEGFKVTTRGDVIFRNDVFNVTHGGAFVGIDVNFEEVPRRKLMIFDSLIFNTFDWQTLQVNKSSFEVKIANIQLRQNCDCKHLERTLDDAYQLQEIQCLFNEQEFLTYERFQTDNCSIMTGRTTIVVIVCVSLILFIIIVAALVFYFRKAYASDKYGDVKEKKGKLSMIVPDGRTYRETELHVIVERTDLLTTDL